MFLLAHISPAQTNQVLSKNAGSYLAPNWWWTSNAPPFISFPSGIESPDNGSSSVAKKRRQFSGYTVYSNEVYVLLEMEGFHQLARLSFYPDREQIVLRQGVEDTIRSGAAARATNNHRSGVFTIQLPPEK